jgi:hypothetical protein
MFKIQKEIIKAVASTNKSVICYFPRQMGKTRLRNYIKKIGKVANSGRS